LPAALAYAKRRSKAARIIALSYPKSASEALYSFAIATMYRFVWTANLGEQGGESGGHFGIFLDRLPRGLGLAISSLHGSLDRPPLSRTFQHGGIFVNPGAAAVDVHIPAGVDLWSGRSMRHVDAAFHLSLPARAAAVFVQTPGQQ
jgi:hypothetical protein